MWPFFRQLAARVRPGCPFSVQPGRADFDVRLPYSVHLCKRRVRAMYWSGGGEEVSATLVNAALLALWPVLPALLIAYVRLALVTRRLPPKFDLRKSEAAELDRAVSLYQDVRQRLA